VDEAALALAETLVALLSPGSDSVAVSAPIGGAVIPEAAEVAVQDLAEEVMHEESLTPDEAIQAVGTDEGGTDEAAIESEGEPPVSDHDHGDHDHDHGDHDHGDHDHGAPSEVKKRGLFRR
jgi:hypothetical protein